VGRIQGLEAARALILAGFDHDAVIRGLRVDLDLTAEEAEKAWEAATERLSVSTDNRVAQASVMVAAQADCNLAAAIALMEQLAVDTDSTVEDIATLVIEREIRLGDADVT